MKPVGKLYRGPCPCGSRLVYASCCRPLHNGGLSSDAEGLMRSRYSAYVLKLEDYLLETWHPQTRPPGLDLEVTARRWLGLKIVRHELRPDETAIVEFMARYKAGGRTHDYREISQFVRVAGRWLYWNAEG